jgi:hypothetical protein
MASFASVVGLLARGKKCGGGLPPLATPITMVCSHIVLLQPYKQQQQKRYHNGTCKQHTELLRYQALQKLAMWQFIFIAHILLIYL